MPAVNPLLVFYSVLCSSLLSVELVIRVSPQEIIARKDFSVKHHLTINLTCILLACAVVNIIILTAVILEDDN